MSDAGFPSDDNHDQVVRDRLYGSVEALCRIGEKVSGSAEEARACAYLVDALSSAGVRHVVHEFDSYISAPSHTAVTILGAQHQPIPAVGVAFTRSTGPAGIEGTVIYIKGGKSTDFAEVDVKGKIVLVDKIPEAGACMAAQAAGAVGLIGASSGAQLHKMTASPIWGAPANSAELDRMPKVAVASISGVDGARIKALLLQGEVRVHLVSEVSTSWEKVRLPVAEIPGEQPEFLLLGAHYCTWFDGATDNIAANAILLELARWLQQGPTQKYGVRLAWWPGHTHGRYSGSAWYADRYWTTLERDAIAYFNVDINGSRGAHFKCARNQTAEIADFVEQTIRPWTDRYSEVERGAMKKMLRRPERYVDVTRPTRGSDQSFLGIGLSSLQISSFLGEDDPNRVPGGGLAKWWHAKEDTPASVDADVLLDDFKLHQAVVSGILGSSVLPFRIARIGDDLSAALREYTECAPGLPLLEELHALAETFAAAAQRMEMQAVDATNTARRNRLNLSVTRILNPVLYQIKDRFEHDPATPSRLLPGLADALKWANADETGRKTMHINLQRQKNRIAHAISSATALLNAPA